MSPGFPLKGLSGACFISVSVKIHLYNLWIARSVGIKLLFTFTVECHFTWRFAEGQKLCFSLDVAFLFRFWYFCRLNIMLTIVHALCVQKFWFLWHRVQWSRIVDRRVSCGAERPLRVTNRALSSTQQQHCLMNCDQILQRLGQIWLYWCGRRCPAVAENIVG